MRAEPPACDQGRPVVLITRPEPGAADTARRVADCGFAPIVSPALAIERVPARLPPPDRIAGIIITSGNAVDAYSSAYFSTPVWAVGRATARRARAAGFCRVVDADGDAVALTALVAANLSPDTGALLLATASGQGGRLCGLLRQHGFRVLRRVVYRARPAHALSAEALQALHSSKVSAALFFSAETASAFIRLIRASGLSKMITTIAAVAISPPVGVALGALPWRCIRIAAKPNQDAMLALLR